MNRSAAGNRREENARPRDIYTRSRRNAAGARQREHMRKVHIEKEGSRKKREEYIKKAV